MSKKEQRKAPVLRFKGFTDDWEQRKLGDKITRIKSYSISHGYETMHDTNTKYIHYGDIHTGKVKIINDINILPNIKDNNYIGLNKGDIVVADASEDYKGIADACLVNTDTDTDSNKIVAGLHTIALRPQKDTYPQYLYTYLSTDIFKHFGYKTGTGLKVFGISYKELAKFLVSSPSIKEQKEISKLISLIEKNIDLQQRKLDQLKQLKKAYLSDLFSIKNKPQIRFKGFKGKWKKSKLLDNVSNIIDFRGKTPKKLGMDWSDQGILALSALNVKDGFIDKSIHAHYGDIKLYNKWMAGNKLHKGQVLFTTEAPMGNVAQVPDNDKYILSQRTIAFNVNKDKISDFFLAMLLQTTTVHNQLLSLSSGGTAKGVSQKSLSGLSVAIPLSLEEQRKMEMAFKYINHLIHFQQDKIRYLEENKQFLLQNMFI